MSAPDVAALAAELRRAVADCQTIAVPPSAREAGLDLDAAYAVGRELIRLRCAEGHRKVGLKVGFANKAAWRVMKLDTLVWAPMYDDTVRFAEHNDGSLSLARMCAPKIEPEIVFKTRRPLAPGTTDAAVVLESVEWLALGFEIIDCVFADWKFQPPDFVAAYGFHAALVVGSPLSVGADNIQAIAEALPRFTVTLARDGQLVAEGSGRNSLRSPALCLGELATALSRCSGAGAAVAASTDAGAGASTGEAEGEGAGADAGAAESLTEGDLVSSGTLTESRPIAVGETWTATVDGLDLPTLTLRVVA